MADDDKKDLNDSEKDRQNPEGSSDAQSSADDLSLNPKEKSVDPWTGSSMEQSKDSTSLNSSDQESSSEHKPPQGSGGPDLSKENWERDVLNRLAFATLNEQRRSRRWGVFFKALGFIYVGAFLLILAKPLDSTSGGISGGKHTALIEINGAIGPDNEASADNIVGGLRDAFKDKDTAAVILRINSPGGSPVQAGYVYDEIKRLRNKYPNTKLYAVIVDICASGGYYIAAAADEIYADKASIVGSIGVLMNGFGFVDAMNKLGVERRLVTAGEHKGTMDPFSPLKKDELKHVQGMLDQIHQQFINVVKEGRADRLKLEQYPDMFSGLFWNGEEGVKRGLVDDLGTASSVARDVVKVEKIVDFTVRPRFFDRFAERLGAGIARVMANTVGLEAFDIR